MYLTVKETADYLSMPETKVLSLILEGKIRAVHNGENFLVNKDQFTTHMEQVEKYRKIIQEYLNEPLPDDLDVKDED